MAAASATCAYASSFRSPGTKGYTHGTLEGNWFEERTRAEAGEFVQVPMMLTPDVRTMIIGSKCVPAAAKEDGSDLAERQRHLNPPSRRRAHRRGLADDGFCEYETVTRSMFKPMDEKIVHPVCREPGEWYSPFLGSGIQHDGRSKTRVRRYACHWHDPPVLGALNP